MELTILSYLDIIIQIIIGSVLVADYFYFKRENLKLHSTMMTTIFLVNTVLILVVMLPPFLGETDTIFGNLAEFESLLFASHHTIGLVAEFLSGFVILRYIVRAFKPSSCKHKKLMKATVTIWLLSIISGIILFLWHIIGE